jgi:hypothetical protein
MISFLLKLLKQEDQLRQEEEALYEARRLAARIASGNDESTIVQRQKAERRRTNINNHIPNVDNVNKLSLSSSEDLNNDRSAVCDDATNETITTLSSTSRQWSSSVDWDL